MPTPVAILLDQLNELDECQMVEAKRGEEELGKSAVETISAFANEPGLGAGAPLAGRLRRIRPRR